MKEKSKRKLFITCAFHFLIMCCDSSMVDPRLIIIVISRVRCTRDSLESYSLSFHDFFFCSSVVVRGRDRSEEWKEFLARFFAVMSAMLLTDWRIVLLPIKEYTLYIRNFVKRKKEKKRNLPIFPFPLPTHNWKIIIIENNLTKN